MYMKDALDVIANTAGVLERGFSYSLCCKRH